MRMDLPPLFYAACAGFFALAAVLSLLLACAGEPQSVWIWRDILGVL
jgi:hypothetical protein